MHYWKDIIKKFSIILALIVFYKVMTYTILPGVSLSVFNPINEATNSITSILFSGGVARYSIMAAGLQPYISSTMIMQMMTSEYGLASFRKLRHEQGGSIKIGEYTQYIMLFISAIQGLYIAYNLYYHPTPIVLLPQFVFYISTIILIMLGSMVSLWISNFISSLNVGSGTSFIICANILSSGDNSIYKLWNMYRANTVSVYILYIVIAMFAFISLLTLMLEHATSKIEVCYPNVEYIASNSHVVRELPLKVNNNGAMPLIMTACMFEVPLLICKLLSKMGWYVHHIQYYILKITNPASFVHYVAYTCMLCFFTYQYSSVVFNPREVAQNLNSSSVLINGVRPGKQTEEFLQNRINALNLVTCVVLIFVCVMPAYVSYYINNQIGLNVVSFGSSGNSSLVFLISTVKNMSDSIQRYTYNFYNILSPYIDIINTAESK